MKSGLETVQNKVAYMEANESDSDYDNYSVDGTEVEEIVRDAGSFFIGDESAKGRGRRSTAGVAADILKRKPKKR